MIGNIVKKEFKELFTISTLIPIVVVAIVFGFIGFRILPLKDSEIRGGVSPTQMSKEDVSEQILDPLGRKR